ncbi:hypothetical protein IMCC21224_12354 [Puniceibacterium sp. IMCC21224]|nr:hypothetical protein IMCC21224_12354 [Puniceibacterium sp. IMCC21224]
MRRNPPDREIHVRYVLPGAHFRGLNNFDLDAPIRHLEEARQTSLGENGDIGPREVCAILEMSAQVGDADNLHRAGLGVDPWLCDPQSPWQKGTIENTNNRLRRYLHARPIPLRSQIDI